jgi:hypothetical protein
MNKTLTILSVILGISSANATDSRSAQNIQETKRQIRIKQALKILLEEGALVIPENQCPEIDPSLLEELRKNGTLTPSNGPVLSSICIVSET